MTWPPSNPTSIRTRSSATRHQLREHAVDGIGMDVRDLEREEAAMRLLVDQFDTLLGEVAKLAPASADPDRGRLDALLDDGLAPLELCAEEPAVRLERLVEVVDRNAEVVYPLHLHAMRMLAVALLATVRRPRVGLLGVLLDALELHDPADGLARLRLGLEVSEQREDLVTDQRLLLE